MKQHRAISYLATFAIVAILSSPPLLAVAAEPSELSSADRDFFEAKVRPILAEHCLSCHSAGKAVESNLRLDGRPGWVKGGDRGPAIKPGDPDGSLLVKAIRHSNPDLKMPPDEKLKPAQIAALEEWVRRGAPDPRVDAARTQEPSAADAAKHWAFQLLMPPKLPDTPAGAAATAVDAFVLDTLRSKQLTLTSPADRRTLIRRAWFDLVGVPPDSADVDSFASDQDPDAFARLVDRLLASPRYGERWGRHWLDVARFADTKDGVLMYGDDRVRPYAYGYRDYVLRAFNTDLPLDRFIHEQLAADLIEPKVSDDRLAALGLLTLGRLFDNNIHDVIDDQIDVVSRGLLGLTVSCARCHNHKFDPIPTADYYSLYGVFASSETPLVSPRLDPEARGGAKFEEQFAANERGLREMLDKQHDLLSETARQRAGDYLVHIATTPADPLETAIFFLSLAPTDLRPPMIGRWRTYVAQRSAAGDAVFAPWNDLMASDEQRVASDTPAVLARWRERGGVNSLVMEALSRATLTSRADIARTYGDLLKRVYDESKVAEAKLSVEQKQLLDVMIAPDSPLFFPKRLTRQYMSRKEKDEFGGKIQQLDKLAVQDPTAPPRAMVLFDAPQSYDPRVFLRGNPSRPGPPVPRQMLGLVAGPNRQPFQRGSGRLELAQAITSKANPLTPRVLANRVWMHHFGEPIVDNPSDFGLRTPRPLFLPLLDHLASSLVRNDWSLKSLHREIMLSDTYRQSSVPSAEALVRDPENRLFSRMNRRRLELEAMRDTMLAVSGRIEHVMYGRPVNTASDPANRRRTVYGLVDRQSVPGFYRAFDFANPDQTIERRSATTVPQQALFVLNSPFMLEQARSLAARSEVATASTIDDKLDVLFRLVLQRSPQADERQSLVEFLAADRATTPRSTLSPLEQSAQVLLLTNELLFID